MSHRASVPTNSDINALVLEMRQAGTDSTYEIVKAALSRWAAPAAQAVEPAANEPAPIRVSLPIHWMKELVALCGPEQHELRDRVLKSLERVQTSAPADMAVPDLWQMPMPSNPHHPGSDPVRHIAWAKGAGAAMEAVETALAATPPAQAQDVQRDAIRELIAKHGAELEQNAYAYFELAYTRQTGWMAWITDHPRSMPHQETVKPDRKVLASGQGDTAEAACAAAIAASAAQGEA